MAELCDGAVKHYIAEMQRRAKARGLDETPTMNPAYFQWLAAFQVAGQSYQEIAAAVKYSRTAVTNGIREAAELINLQLRVHPQPYRRF